MMGGVPNQQAQKLEAVQSGCWSQVIGHALDFDNRHISRPMALGIHISGSNSH